MVAKKREITPSYRIKEGLMEEFTTERISERIRKLLKPQELTSIPFLPSDSCSRRLGTAAALTQGKVPFVKDPSGPSLSIILKTQA